MVLSETIWFCIVSVYVCVMMSVWLGNNCPNLSALPTFTMPSMTIDRGLANYIFNLLWKSFI